MRLTPSQMAMLLLCGKQLPMSPDSTLKERIHKGYEMMKHISKSDFGMDLEKWHSHLRKTDEGGYTFENRHIEIKIEIDKTLKDSEWVKTSKEVNLV